MTVPNGPNDTATFEASNQPNITISANTEVNGITFNAGSMYTLTNNAGTAWTISGTGITNNSGVVQSFIISGQLAFTNSASIGNGIYISDAPNATITFSNSASPGHATVFPYNGSAVNFLGSTTAANATFFHGAAADVNFYDSSTAGNATFNNSGSSRTMFFGTSNAGSANFTLQSGSLRTDDNSPAQFADKITAPSGGSPPPGSKVVFNNNSSAANANFSMNSNSSLDFADMASAGNSTITCNAGAKIFLSGTSSAGTATLIANTGSNMTTAGRILLWGSATADTAHVQVLGNGNLNLTGNTAPGLAVGSIQGDGFILLGSRTLTVGTNDGTTTFSGQIQDTSPGGSIIKEGTGTLILTNSSSYRGPTLINNGTLRASADLALGASSTIGAYLSVGVNGTLTLDSGATNNYIPDFASLFLVSGSTVNLNFTGNADRLRSLFVNGVQLPPGIYGSVASGAPNQLSQLNGIGKIIATTRAVSRKIHGPAGAFDIDLPLAGPPGIECRLGGTNHDYQIVLTFFDNVAFSFVSVPTNTAVVANASGNNTNTITIDLTGVANAQTTQIIVHNLNDGTNMTDLYLSMGVLIADVNANRVVNASDVAQVKSQSGQPVTASNFRSDINCNGAINAGDIIQPKLQSGTFLP